MALITWMIRARRHDDNTNAGDVTLNGCQTFHLLTTHYYYYYYDYYYSLLKLKPAGCYLYLSLSVGTCWMLSVRPGLFHCQNEQRADIEPELLFLLYLRRRQLRHPRARIQYFRLSFTALHHLRQPFIIF